MEDHQIIDSGEDELSLKQVIHGIINWFYLILSKKGKIAVFCLIGCLAGIGYSIYKKPVYKAELSFALEDAKGGGGLSAYSGIASQFGLDVGGGGGGAFTGDNLMELMKSRSMIQKALLTTVNVKGKNETLAELYISYNKLREDWAAKPELGSVKFLPGADTVALTLTQDSLISAFHKSLILKNLMVEKLDKKLSIISITVKSENELFSKYFTEVLADKVSQFYIDTKTKKTAQNVRILQHQTDSVRRELNGAISNVAASIDVNPNANPVRQMLRVSSQHHQVDVEVNKAMLAELVKNLEVAKVSLRSETPLIQVIDKPVLPLDVERTGKIKSALIGIFAAFFIAIFIITINTTLKNILK
ncbi:lipopolysaccharide biosynthesis protein [uncultured Mucilaginibacter sp.]|uniref:lipopolysaccharide biosynthesis protein n=1 Tax=uncultured Mucilaginibacter sp. TaxID=797541 RepID=UPI0025E40A10|nr:lipopolysaccharide biosynthesis protein [uncultured Mucilaginibacter sp.]